ncbi:MAG: TetR/AcrR family transcriptional regulator [Oscillospiraceae bacterium]|jgi:AcrR family transcriptional regulator|nr:TetR/AcrR family transcriptional regulator [Oscillospiraceae bacterium]
MADRPDNRPPSAEYVNYLGRSYRVPFQDSNPTRDRILLCATKMFVRAGYAGISIRDIAAANGLRAASIYHHFPSKENLLETILLLARDCYRVYIQTMQAKIYQAKDFSQVMATLFEEPLRMENEFTCYAFTLVTQMQFESDLAWQIYHDVFLGEMRSFLAHCFEDCIVRGLTKPFPVLAAAETTALTLLAWVSLATQQYCLGRQSDSFDAREGVRRFMALMAQYEPQK